jgi:hypothetical protein
MTMRSGATTTGGDGPLFDQIRDPARNDGPETSKLSARHLKASGKMNKQCVAALAALREYIARTGVLPTNQELAGGDPALVHIYSRRLADLRVNGAIRKMPARKCRVTGRQAATWEPCDDGREEESETGQVRATG